VLPKAPLSLRKGLGPHDAYQPPEDDNTCNERHASV